MRALVNGCQTKSFDRGHTRFEQHVNKLDGSGHTLKRRLLALCQLILEPKHDILAVVFTHTIEKQGFEVKVRKKKVSAAKHNNCIVEFRFTSQLPHLHTPSR